MIFRVHAHGARAGADVAEHGAGGGKGGLQIRRGVERQQERAGEEQRKERNIVFHSLRHFCATILSQRTDMKTVQAILGHRSEKMSIHYSDHDTEEKLSNIKNIMQNAWKNYQIA